LSYSPSSWNYYTEPLSKLKPSLVENQRSRIGVGIFQGLILDFGL